MAAPTEVHECCETNPMEQIKLGVFEKIEHVANISSQLLYPETYGDSYRENKLTVLGKGSPAVKGQQKTVEMPQSSVMSRIKSFLPQLASANKDMAQELAANPDNADRFNIEHIEDSEEVQVEMNFSLIPPELLGEGDSTTDDSSSESDSEPEVETQSQVSELLSETDRQPTLKLRAVSSRLVKPSIEVLDDVQLKNDAEEICKTETGCYKNASVNVNTLSALIPSQIRLAVTRSWCSPQNRLDELDRGHREIMQALQLGK